MTFFFNGGEERVFPGEDRILIPSPPSEEVPTFDLKPEMSAYEVTDAVVKCIDEEKYDVIILNFANCDMVGHTGVMEAAIKAVRTVDECTGRVVSEILKHAASASSPPTMATPTRCSIPYTAAPSPPTPPTRCR